LKSECGAAGTDIKRDSCNDTFIGLDSNCPFDSGSGVTASFNKLRIHSSATLSSEVLPRLILVLNL
jgi:hypothetical protein